MQENFKFKTDPANDKPKMSGRINYDFPAPGEKPNGIALIGEAPGAEEVKLGHPFVGRSGQLLDKILGQAAINRTQCMVANVFRFQPPGNKVDHFFISRRAAAQQNIAIAEEYGKFGSTWVRSDFAEEIENLRDTLTAHRKTCGGKLIIVALGRTPLWALTGEGELLKKVGKTLPCRLLPGSDVMPTYHPSFILRGNWGLQPEWLKHFELAKTHL